MVRRNIRSALTQGLQQPESCTLVLQFMSLLFLPRFLQVCHLIAANADTETHYSRTLIHQFKCQNVTGGFGSCYFGLSLRYLKDAWFSEIANDMFIGCLKSNIQMQEQTKSLGFENFECLRLDVFSFYIYENIWKRYDYLWLQWPSVDSEVSPTCFLNKLDFFIAVTFKGA